MKRSGVKVFAPATVANVAVGFDILGLAIDQPGDEIIARPSEVPGIHINTITGDRGKLPKDPYKNTASYSAIKMLEHLDIKDRGIELDIHKKMPFGSGLGSSAASAVAGVVACNEILGRPLSRKELLPFAVQGEQIADGSIHADNVAPSLLGGICLIRDIDTFDVIRIPVPKGLFVTVVYPIYSILTKDARDILSQDISLSAHIDQSNYLASFICALYNSDLDLIARSLKDVIIEPQRSRLIPGFYRVQEAALNAGALGCSISGAGPTMFALSSNSLIADKIGKSMSAVFASEGIDSKVYSSLINSQGAIVY